MNKRMWSLIAAAALVLVPGVGIAVTRGGDVPAKPAAKASFADAAGFVDKFGSILDNVDRGSGALADEIEQLDTAQIERDVEAFLSGR